MKKVEELKDLGCSVRGRFYDLAWSKPVLRAPAGPGVSSIFLVLRRSLKHDRDPLLTKAL